MERLDIPLTPSRRFLGALLTLHFAIIAGFSAILAPGACVLVALAVGMNALWLLRRMRRFLQVERLILQGQESALVVQDKRVVIYEVKPLWLFLHIVVLELVTERGRWLLPILGDSVHSEDFRRLRRALRVFTQLLPTP